jgi:Ca-activated chloride channel family protein
MTVPGRIPLSGWALLWLLTCGASFGTWREVETGNRALAEGDAKRAESHYRAALNAHPDDPRLTYNLGTATLQEGDAQGAEALFEQAAEAADAEVAARAHFNRGNALFARAEQAADPAVGQALYRQAVQAYRQALAQDSTAGDPTAEDARINLQLAASRLRESQQQNPSESKQDKSANDADGNKDSDSNDSPQSRSGEPGDKGESGKSSPQDGQEKPDGQQADQPEDAAGQEPDGSRAENGAGNPPDHSDHGDGEKDRAASAGAGEARQALGEEEVARILSGLARREAGTLREAVRRSMGPAPRVERDW